MKLLILCFVAAVWLPMKGEATWLPNLEFNQPIARSSLVTSDESQEVSDTVKDILHDMFTDDSWRDVVVEVAPQATMEDPAFRAKWKVTEADDKEKEDDAKDDVDKDERDSRLEAFLNSEKWKGLIALSSTKEELVDDAYRRVWGLGDLSAEVENSEEGGNFFDGPQWREFSRLTGMVVGGEGDLWEAARTLMLWIVDVGEEMRSFDA